MKLKVLGSSSAGNCYLLETDTECLIIEAGVSYKRIEKAVNFNTSKISGCIFSHQHLDHSYYVGNLMLHGINCFSGDQCFGTDLYNYYANVIEDKEMFKVGSFRIMPFLVNHDVQCFSYLIHHKECGKVLFVTDTHYIDYRIDGLNNIMIEANYSEEIVDDLLEKELANKYVIDRVRESHMSFETALNVMSANDLTNVNNIVLLHLSNSNSNSELFKRRMTEKTGKNVHVADMGMEIEFNKTGF